MFIVQSIEVQNNPHLILTDLCPSAVRYPVAQWEPCIFSLCLISIIDQCKVQSVHSIISGGRVFGEAELGILKGSTGAL